MESRKTKQIQFAIWCVKQIEHLLPVKSKSALDIVEKFCNGDASPVDLQNAKTIAWEAVQDAIYGLNESAKDAAWAAYYAAGFEHEKAARCAAAAAGYAAGKFYDPRHAQARNAAIAAQEAKRLEMLEDEKFNDEHEYFVRAATGSIEGIKPQAIKVVKNNDELLADVLQFVINEADSNNNTAYELRERMADVYAAAQTN